MCIRDSLVGQLLLQPVAVGDVAQAEHDALDGGIGQQVLHTGLDMAPGAVAVTHAALQKAGLGVPEGLPQGRSHGVTVVGMDDAEQVAGCLLYTSPSPRDRTRSR